MTVDTDGRFGLTSWSAGTDPLTRAQLTASMLAIADLGAIDRQGLEAARPASGIRGTYYYATDTRRLWRDNGTGWTEVPTLTSAGALRIGDTARTAATVVSHRLAVSTDAASSPAVGLMGAPAQTAALVSLFTSSGTETFRALVDGALAAGRSLTRSAFVTIRPPDGAERGMLVDHVASPTGELARWSTDGTPRIRFDPVGRIYIAALSDSADPATPSGAGVLYCDNVGRLKYRGPGGTTTTLAER